MPMPPTDGELVHERLPLRYRLASGVRSRFRRAGGEGAPDNSCRMI